MGLAADGNRASPLESAGDRHVLVDREVSTASFRDHIEGDGRANVLDAGGGDDFVSGGGGNDTVEGGNDNDLLYGGSGADAVEGGNGNDVLEGNAGSDFLSGGNDNDVLYASGRLDTRESVRSHNVLSGGNGDDVLIAGRGYDEMSGDLGSDTFRYRTIADASERVDRITDFGLGGADRIDLSQIDANATTAANDTFVFRGTAASSRIPAKSPSTCAA